MRLLDLKMVLRNKPSVRTARELAKYWNNLQVEEKTMNKLISYADKFNQGIAGAVIKVMQFKQDDFVTKEELYFEPCGFKRGDVCQ
ncbi:MAG: hypothetical protein ACWGHH_06675 [Sulfurovaceae bacterium]